MIKKLSGKKGTHSYHFDTALKYWLKQHVKKTGQTIGFCINEALIDYAAKNGVQFEVNHE